MAKMRVGGTDLAGNQLLSERRPDVSQRQRLRRLIRASSLFDPKWYLEAYPDVVKSGVDAAEHYLLYGWRLRRDPSPGFSTERYLAANPDVARSGINPLIHYLVHGRSEGRQCPPSHANSERGRQLRSRVAVQDPGTIARRSEWRPTIPVLEALVQRSSGIVDELPTSVIDDAKRAVRPTAPRISVITPTWNRSAFVGRAIDSALSQSFAPHEIIVSDDGSTDGTIEHLHENYADAIRSGLLKVVVNEHHGVSAARNAALAIATGELICYLDSDNVWREHYLLFVAAAFQECDELHTSYCALNWLQLDSNRVEVLGRSYDRRELLHANFIDLNVFAHRRSVYEQLGGFDESMNRLVDWDLIIRYTKLYEPVFFPFIGVDYHLSQRSLQNITYSVPLEENRNKIHRRNFMERIALGLDELRIAYFVYDFPALSQTFVLNEIRWFVQNGYDIKVYYAADPDVPAVLDFEVEQHRVADALSLANLFTTHERNICHSHFVYPGVTRFVWPACVESGVHFTFMPHAVDIFHHDNRRRNQIAEIARHELCVKVFVYGDHHRRFLENQRVPRQKVAYAFQAVDTSDFDRIPAQRNAGSPLRGVVFARYIEKKGIRHLLDAANLLDDVDVAFDIYGYGPLEAELNAQARELSLTNVTFHGAVSGKARLAGVYRSADFLVAPCVEASDGDMDGFPTVLLEALAAGVPVIATRLSAIPDYLRDGVEAILVPPADPHALASAVRQLLGMSEARRSAMIGNAQRFLAQRVGTTKTVRRLLDTWSGYSVDLTLVTFNREGYDDRDETREIISRIIERTTSAFTLTIIDNDSTDDFWAAVVDQVRGNSNVRLIRKRTNTLCGPATNTSLAMGSAELAVYVCSKEGFVRSHGWEQALIDYMRSNPTAAMAGHRVYLPKFVYGSELVQHPEFLNFRNQHFAHARPRRAFGHIQGGLFVARRKTLLEVGGFNPLTPQANMDVEMSYYLESKGHLLGEIPELASVTTKTLPRLFAVIDEKTVAAHPLTCQTAPDLLDSVANGDGRRCNVCGWVGSSFNRASDEGVCPACGSTPFGRLVFRVLANDHRIYRDGRCALLSGDTGLAAALANRLFRLDIHTSDRETFEAALAKGSTAKFACIIVDPACSASFDSPQAFIEALDDHGEILLPSDAATQFEPLLQARRFGIASEALAFDWRGVTRLTRDLDTEPASDPHQP